MRPGNQMQEFLHTLDLRCGNQLRVVTYIYQGNIHLSHGLMGSTAKRLNGFQDPKQAVYFTGACAMVITQVIELHSQLAWPHCSPAIRTPDR